MIEQLALPSLALLWIVRGYYAFVYSLGYFWREWPGIQCRSRWISQCKNALCLSLFGQIALLVGLMDGLGKHGRLYPWQETP